MANPRGTSPDSRGAGRARWAGPVLVGGPVTLCLARCYYCGTLVSYDPAGAYLSVTVFEKRYPLCVRCHAAEPVRPLQKFKDPR